MFDGLTFALPKGRILAAATKLLQRAGIAIDPIDKDDRRLRLELPGGHRVLLVKPTDVPVYVERGVADIGIAGADTLDEQGRDLYEPVDLGIGACRLVVAEPRERPARLRRGMALVVATKYPRLARRHYALRGIEPEIIELFGSVELAAIAGLADQIVDLVESGETLRQNGLVEVETVMDVTSRLIVHPASLKLRHAELAAFVDAVREAVMSPAETRTSKATGT